MLWGDGRRADGVGKIDDSSYVILGTLDGPETRLRLLSLHDDREVTVVAPPGLKFVDAGDLLVEPPCLATVLFDPDEPGEVLVDEVVPLVVPVMARARRGGPWQFELPGGMCVDVDRFGLPPELVQVLSDRGRKNTEQAPFRLRLDCGRPEVVWLEPGGKEGWLERRGRRHEERALERARARWQSRLRDERRPGVRDNLFVNPYTFVPLPPVVRRSAPAGHDRLGDGRLSGSFRVRWSLASPLLLPLDHPVDGPVVVPGSSVKGAVRSVHEVLADGCLRVLDPEWTAVHRQASPENGGSSAVPRALAVVHEVDPSGAPLSMVRCEPTVRLSLREAVERIGPDRAVWHSGMVFESDGARWVLHVSALKPGSHNGQTHVVIARLTERIVDVAPEAASRFRDLCSGSADLNGRARDRSSDEKRCLPGPDGKLPLGTVWAPVKLQGAPQQLRLLLRRRTTGRLQPGDSLWVNEGTGRVERFAPSQLWREHGRYSVGERLAISGLQTGSEAVSDDGEERLGDVSPCCDVDRLCPTCQIFGAAADVRAGEQREVSVRAASGRSVQRSYAAHVRFGPATSASSVARVVYELPPQGSPRPLSGGFYLEPRWSVNRRIDVNGRIDVERALVAAEASHVDRMKSSGSFAHGPTSPSDRPPLSYWGSAEDSGDDGPRRIAGRCFYWHGFVPWSEENPYPRHLCRPASGGSELAQNREVVEPPAVLESDVWFEGLTREQLGGLLAAVQPGLVLHDVDFGQRDPDTGRPVIEGRLFSTHLGGGKGLGLGSVRPEVVPGSLQVHDAASRYAAAESPVETPESLAAQYKAAVLGDDSRPPLTWQSLASVLTEDRVPATLLWYPPGCTWDKRIGSDGTPGAQFDKSFQYFQQHRGGGLGGGSDLGLQALPAAVEPVQTLLIELTTPKPATRADQHEERRGR
jgi:hypothetical protein